MKVVLKPLELLWRGVNRLRRMLYRRGILQARRLPRPVISVGSISAGGAGKTPTVIAICRELEAHGLSVAVLTRGYGRSGGESGVVATLDAARFGDEPVLIQSKLVNTRVIIGSSRYINATRFLNTNDCDVFVLDDGFQHLQLARDVDVVVDPAPGSVLREGRSALRHADFVIPRRLRLTIPEELRTRPVFAFAGLADNEQFFESLRAAGLRLTGTRSFPDHHRYTPEDLAGLARAAGGAPIVTTEKDMVKAAGHDMIAIAAEMVMDPAVLSAIVARISS